MTSTDDLEQKVWTLCKLPFWRSASAGPLSSSRNQKGRQQSRIVDQSNLHSSTTLSSVVKSFLPARRRLTLDPPNTLHFPYEPGKQVKSAIRMKNACRSHVAFKFQTTAPKSCFMRPPGGILAPGESLIATVFKFVEDSDNKEKLIVQKGKVKFKIMSLKVKGDIDYIPELFDEQKDQVAVEKVLRAVFLDPEHPCPALDKLNQLLDEAEVALQGYKKPLEDTGTGIVGEGLVIDEWKERRERYLARKQVKAS